jgi:hypothetical protein
MNKIKHALSRLLMLPAAIAVAMLVSPAAFAASYGMNIDRSGHSQYGERYAVIKVSDLTSGENDSGFDFQAGDIIDHVFIKVRTAEVTGSTKTIDVGLLSSESGGDADGFLDGVSTAATGIISPALTNGARTQGLLLTDDEDGSGALVPMPYVVTTAVSLTYTHGDVPTELDAEIHVRYFRPQP